MLSAISSKTYSTVDYDKILHEIHKEIYELSWIEKYSAGWNECTKKASRCKKIAYQVSLLASGAVIIFFTGACFLFGVLALKQGIVDIKADGRAPIIGHFTEWSMLGIFTGSKFFIVLNEISLLGEQKKAQILFLKSLKNTDLSNSKKCEIYDAYLDFLRNRPFTSWVSLPNFPKCADNFLSSDTQYFLLKDTYKELEREMANIKYADQIKEGWKIIAAQNSTFKKSIIKTCMVSGGIFLTLHLLNYLLGIFWSGQQAYNDISEGGNPSIGGHSLEWTMEGLAILGAVNYYTSEIANVGKVKIISDLFYKKIAAIKEESQVIATRKKERLTFEMRKFIGRIPQGIFFQIPTWLGFRIMDE